MVIANLDDRKSNYEEHVKQMMTEPDSAIVLLGTELSEEDLTIFKGALCYSPY